MMLWGQTWKQIENYLLHDDRVVVPLGSTAQHAYLSVGTDAILCEDGAREAAEPLGVPVLPVMPFGLAPTFSAFPGTITLAAATYDALLGDILDSLYGQGFRRILLLSGHGGNDAPAAARANGWAAGHADADVVFHGWYTDPRVWALATGLAEVGHASWVENLPASRIDGVNPPDEAKQPVSAAALRTATPMQARELLGDGSGGGPYRLWSGEAETVKALAVALLRERINTGWRNT